MAEARRRAGLAGLANVEFAQVDILAPPFAPGSFDHVFVCFVLEHLSQPVSALTRLGGLLRPGGTITVIEGDRGSVLFHPDSPAARAATGCDRGNRSGTPEPEHSRQERSPQRRLIAIAAKRCMEQPRNTPDHGSGA